MRSAILKRFPSDLQPVALLGRLSILALLFLVELLLIPFLADRDFLPIQVSAWGPAIVRSGIAFAVLFTAFAFIRYRDALIPISTEVDRTPINWLLLGTHFVSLAIVVFVSSVFRGHSIAIALNPSPVIAGAACLIIALVSIGSAGFAFIRPVFWLRIAGTTPLVLGIAAAVIAFSAYFAGDATQSLGAFATNTTFHLSQAMLNPFLPGLVADPVNRLIGTARFMVTVSPTCSGLEGIGLILVFGISSLAVFRKEFRFPHALLLLPVAVVTVFIFNSFRIAALVLIGNAGAEQIAMRGFHSEAGWMVFCLVAIAFSLAARKVPWLSVNESAAALRPQLENPTAKWLLPFVTLLAVGMLSAAGTGSFEWSYPVRFFAVVLTLIFLRGRYRNLDLSVSWWAPAIGLAVFLIWIGLDRFSPGGFEAAPSPLAATSPLLRTMWLIFRVLAATVTVPIAEELAFRGFLYRRLQSPDFDNVSFQRFSWIAMLIASITFGLLHGNRWFVGCLAGALYTLVLVRRGSMGDAIAAHATTNALLAFDVLAFHRWHLW